MMKKIEETTFEDVFRGMFLEEQEKSAAVNSARLCRYRDKKLREESDVFCPMCEIYHENNSMCQAVDFISIRIYKEMEI